MAFDHERLDVYRRALELVVVAHEVAANLPKGRGYLTDQLRRAATSIPLNIAEGAGEFAPQDKARFYRFRPTLSHRDGGDPRRLPQPRAAG